VISEYRESLGAALSFDRSLSGRVDKKSKTICGRPSPPIREVMGSRQSEVRLQISAIPNLSQRSSLLSRLRSGRGEWASLSFW
jgi:hypothetical protein